MSRAELIGCGAVALQCVVIALLLLDRKRFGVYTATMAHACRAYERLVREEREVLEKLILERKRRQIVAELSHQTQPTPEELEDCA